MLSNIDIISFVNVAVLWMLSLISASWLYTFYLLRNRPSISSRKPTSAFLIGVLCVIGLILTYPCTIIFLNTTSFPNFPQKRPLIRVLILFTNIGGYHVVTYRSWMVYFDIKWNKALEDAQWRLHIDPNEKNWFLKHKHSWGNSKRVGMALFIHITIWAVFLGILELIQWPETSMKLVLACSGLIPTICDIIMYIKFPAFDDIWGITTEIKWTLTLELLVLILAAAASYIVQPQDHSYELLIFSIWSAVTLFVYVYIIHYRVLKRANLPINACAAKRYLNETQCAERMGMTTDLTIINIATRISTTSTEKHSNQSSNGMKKEMDATIEDVVSDENGFNEFARYLTKEFCLENLLFLIETQQWLLSLNILQTDNIKLTFPETAPKSEIIQSDDIYLQCAQLFIKYISNDAYFCINISGITRETIYEQIGCNNGDEKKSTETISAYLREKQIGKEQLFGIFEEARIEILRLISYAFTRFKASKQYQEITRKIVIEC